MVGGVVEHAIGVGTLGSPAAADVYLLADVGMQAVVNPHILALGVVLAVVAIADAERAVGILVVKVVGAGLINKGVGLIVLAVPHDVVDTHCGVRHIENLELAILVTGIENKLEVVAPLKTLESGDVRLNVATDGAFLIVLHYHSIYLLIGIGYGQRAVVELHRDLLVALAGVYVGIARGAHAELHLLLGNHKLGHKHLAVVVVFIKHMQTVVAADLQAATRIWQLQLVVGVGDDGVGGVLVVVDGVAIESSEPIALENALGGSPVGLTMLKLIDVAMEVVRELVERHGEHIVRVEPHDGWGEPVAVYHHLQRLNIGIIDAAFGKARYSHKPQ